MTEASCSFVDLSTWMNIDRLARITYRGPSAPRRVWSKDAPGIRVSEQLLDGEEASARDFAQQCPPQVRLDVRLCSGRSPLHEVRG